MLSSVSVLSLAPSSEDFFFNSWSKVSLTMKPVASSRRLARTDDDDGDDATFQKVTTDASSSPIARERRRKTTDRSDASLPSPLVSSLSRARTRASSTTDPPPKDDATEKEGSLQSSSFSRSRARASVTARLAPDEFAQENFLVRIERLRGSKTRERGRRQSRVASTFFDWKNARKTPPERWTIELHPAASRRVRDAR